MKKLIVTAAVTAAVVVSALAPAKAEWPNDRPIRVLADAAKDFAPVSWVADS